MSNVDMLSHFTGCVAFIAAALGNNEHILVHWYVSHPPYLSNSIAIINEKQTKIIRKKDNNLMLSLSSAAGVSRSTTIVIAYESHPFTSCLSSFLPLLLFFFFSLSNIYTLLIIFPSFSAFLFLLGT